MFCLLIFLCANFDQECDIVSTDGVYGNSWAKECGVCFFSRCLTDIYRFVTVVLTEIVKGGLLLKLKFMIMMFKQNFVEISNE